MFPSDGHYIFKSAFPRTQEQFQGSSFKPLSLAYHPWVRAFQRDTMTPDVSKPRLSFLTQHYHLYGQDSLSLLGSQGDIIHPTETVTESEDSTSSSGDPSESAEEESTSSEVGSDNDVVTKLSHSEIDGVDAITAPLSYVLRPSCINHRRSSSSSTSSSTTFSSSRSRRQISVTSPDMGLSAFHDMFTTSISPSDSTLFKFPSSENFHRGNRKKKRNHA